MSLRTIYDIGDLVRVTGAFTNHSDGTALNPTAVLFKYKNPVTGTITTLVYGTDAAIVRDSTGNYHVDVDASVPGRWYFRFYATGTGQSADEDYFDVAQSEFD